MSLFQGYPFSVKAYLQRGRGYYIPEYQRQYSWDVDNIEQLMEDIVNGVIQNVASPSDEDVRFLGIIISNSEQSLNIKPHFDEFRLINAVDNIIDGQQRISTITLLICNLYFRLNDLKSNLDESLPDELRLFNEITNILADLLKMFTLDINGATPNLKPIVIRSDEDFWTKDGRDPHTNALYQVSPYKSAVANYLSTFITSIINNNPALPSVPTNTVLYNNIDRMNDWFDKIENAYDYPAALNILSSSCFNNKTFFGRQQNLRVYLQSATVRSHLICRIIQLVAFYYFVSDSCYVTLIESPNEDMALDMFQSLNSTGMPLTAIETFKPIVVRYCDNNTSQSGHSKYVGSVSEGQLSLVDQWLNINSKEKIELTNTYLQRFALTYDGRIADSIFSKQRKMINNIYENECNTYQTKELLLGYMANIAGYINDVQRESDIQKLSIKLISLGFNSTQADDTMLCLSYMKKINKMYNAVLTNFYHSIIINIGSTNISLQIDEFVNALKSVVAFNTLWRAALPNRGLDDAYRQVFTGTSNISYKNGLFDSSILKSRLINELSKNNIGVNIASTSVVDPNWLTKAIINLKYTGSDVKNICRFALLVAAHKTEPDPSNSGLMMISSSGVNCLNYTTFTDANFSSIEHIAPETPNPTSNWDPLIYDPNTNHVHKIGNLTLLAQAVNSSVSNLEWDNHPGGLPGKLDYYTSLASITSTPSHPGVPNWIAGRTILSHLTSIVSLSPTPTGSPFAAWDSAHIVNRSTRICEILWQRMADWLA